MELVIATKNLNKLREYKMLLKEHKELGGVLDILSLNDFPDFIAAEETGANFQENAQLKALKCAKELNKCVLADDSGLIVPALNGEPGLFSSRYAGDTATDFENRKKLIEKLKELKPEQRNAYFECHICLADPSGIKKQGVGMCEGTLLVEERGNRGFGYDPLFVKYEYSKTFGELDEFTKNKISHRKKALDKIVPFLESFAKASVH